jgi:hypothetical protein
LALAAGLFVIWALHRSNEAVKAAEEEEGGSPG